MGGPRSNSVALRWGAVTVTLALYLIATLYPFDWEWPVVRNATDALPGGGVRFDGVGIARTAQAPHWVPAAIASNRLHMDMRVRATAPSQAGPARILTLSPDAKTRNLTVGQDGDALIVRLRTAWTTENGTPNIVVPGVFATDAWVDVRIDIAPGQLRIHVDDVAAVQQGLPMTPLALWSPTHALALGNEMTGDRPWLGAIARAEIRVDGERIDYVAPGALEIPTWIWFFDSARLIPLHDLWARDAVLNLVGFVPLGLLFGLLARARDPAGRVRWLRPLGLVVLVSAGVETAQVGFPDRNPSINDLIFNTAGGAIGLALAARLRRSRNADLDRVAG